jgi:hypothetical protein
MKAFAPRPIDQQKKNYVKACKQRMARELATVEERYRQEHDIYAKLYFTRCRIAERIDKAQNHVANMADKEFGGWDVWRHDKVLLEKVVKRMDDAAADLLAKMARIDERMEALMKPYRDACREVSNRYHLLMKTAQ